MNYRQEYEKWLASPALSEDERAELRALEGNDKEIKARFYGPLEFGTAGLRGTMYTGLHNMNRHVIRWATQGFANVIRAEGTEAMQKGIAVCMPREEQKDGNVERGGQKSVPARAAEQHRRAVGRECRAERGEREIGERGKAHRLAPADSPPRAERRHREDVAQREQQEGAVFALHHALVAAEGKKERVDREQGKGIEIGNASAQRHDVRPPSKHILQYKILGTFCQFFASKLSNA